MDNKLGKERWLSPVGLALVQGWARNGFVDEQIAKRMGIARKTLWVWRGNHPELEKVIRAGKEVADNSTNVEIQEQRLEKLRQLLVLIVDLVLVVVGKLPQWRFIPKKV